MSLPIGILGVPGIVDASWSVAVARPTFTSGNRRCVIEPISACSRGGVFRRAVVVASARC